MICKARGISGRITVMGEPLPCIVCGFQPKGIQAGDYQPLNALMFDAGAGHYGSGVWDTMTRGISLNINVCDDCLVARKDRVAVVREVVRRESSYEWLPWDPDKE